MAESDSNRFVLGNVQAKMSCLFETRVVEEPSKKRNYQPYRVEATDRLRQTAVDADVKDAPASEKLDGTCVHVREYEGKPWLWARLDRKPNKVAERKFKKFQGTHNAWTVGGCNGPEPLFDWDVIKDFKDVPCTWIPANGVQVVEGVPQPDKNGHIPGWVPIDPKSRQHLWHLTSVDLSASVGLCLQSQSDSDALEIVLKPLKDLENTTLELIGTHINGNPYQIGSKQQPIHVLVRHGSISFDHNPPLDYAGLKNWFENDAYGQVEGIVWHCHNGQLFKVHRHHVKLTWPIEMPTLSKRPVTINVDTTKYEDVENMTLASLNNISPQTFGAMSDVIYMN